LVFMVLGCQPHAQPPAMLEDQWFSVRVYSLSQNLLF
jgi:hypothetical protein